jgi:hypothetical protein
VRTGHARGRTAGRKQVRQTLASSGADAGVAVDGEAALRVKQCL